MIYLHSSAVLKLLVQEPESDSLEDWLTQQSDVPVASSELARVEVPRACRRLNVEAVPAARVLLGQLDMIPLTTTLLEQAADVGDPLLRALDAIHLASALSIRAELSAFVTYDRRLATATHDAGIGVLQPGR